ncbi:hypothetical protein HV819_07490 [Anaerococcus sp. AGMB00486]|uniref:Uncharacterized protein n=2 Tax=Anaerococcus TaxID=165779 RepID=A0ABX2NAV2_9FIRM|nr:MULTISPECIES: hypothetical protein [Anaerococcus]MDY3005914.1 hypothetical protein [Anaerococcus porci]MSS78021.1 hypothetical protein [Anaerococcus porci]NVF11821.1 hypothetical protein [Anaerococcus faecalis]
MRDLFYRTYPKKVNTKENTGFLDIYELDQRFILLNILQIGNILIEDVINPNDLFDIYPNLGNRDDFIDKIRNCKKLGICSYLKFSRKDFKDENSLIEVLFYWKKNGIGCFFLDFTPSFDVVSMLKRLKISFISLENFDIFNKFSSDFIKASDKNIYLKNYIHKINEDYDDNFISLNKSRFWISSKVLNFSNFYIECAKSLAIISILTKQSSFIKEGEELLLYKDGLDKEIRKDLFEFYKNLSLIKYEYSDIIKGKYLPLYKKDKDLLAYLFYEDGECLVIMINLSQKDILVDTLNILTKPKFLLGNISRRRIVNTLNLRPYEGIVFGCKTKIQILNN